MGGPYVKCKLENKLDQHYNVRFDGIIRKAKYLI